MRILGLTCSSSRRERNWSTFESIHTKKRNHLEQKKLNDLVFVQYNKKLRERFQAKREKPRFYDPISLDDLEADSEWLVETEDPVFAGESLTWAKVKDAAYGVALGEASQWRRRGVGEASSSTSTRHGPSSQRDDDIEIEEVEEEDIQPLDVDEQLVRTDDEETEEDDVYVEEGDDSDNDDDDDGDGGDVPQWEGRMFIDYRV